MSDFVAFPKIPRLSRRCEFCGAAFSPRRVTMRFCSKKCRYSAWSSLNRDRLNESVRKYRARRYRLDGRWRDEGPASVALKEWMMGLKSEPCVDCGGRFDACCMDFDHRDSASKLYNVGSMFSRHYSRELIESEIAKCDLVCANCHRIRTRTKRIGSGVNGVTHAA